MYRAQIVLDSVSPRMHRLTTVEVEYPRSVLAEVRTHRANYQVTGADIWLELFDKTATDAVSMNSGSSRAIPVKRMIDNVMKDPYIPERWSKAGPGMSEAGWLDGRDAEKATEAWLKARDNAILTATYMMEVGVHKQDANRLLEPWMWVTQVITATDDAWANFFALRTHEAAHPAFRKLARMLYVAYRQSTPAEVGYGQWHLPYVGQGDAEEMGRKLLADPIPADLSRGLTCEELARRVSAARCAWVSYHAPGEQKYTLEKALGTFAKLTAGCSGKDPVHASPLEHQGTPFHPAEEASFPQRRSNLTGWLQFRKLVPFERAPSDWQPAAHAYEQWKQEYVGSVTVHLLSDEKFISTRGVNILVLRFRKGSRLATVGIECSLDLKDFSSDVRRRFRITPAVFETMPKESQERPWEPPADVFEAISKGAEEAWANEDAHP